jgi:ArsR family metal-binding transcriptional regulator
MYLDAISLWKTTACLAEPGKLVIYGRPTRSLEQVIPYLATLPDVIAYDPQACILTFRRRAGFLTLYPGRLFITQVKDADEGLTLLQALTDAVNATWEHRHELTAVTRPRRTPRPLDIWLLLPQTNCKQCGEATCMAFACNLLLQNRELAECVVLKNDPSFEERSATLRTLV